MVRSVRAFGLMLALQLSLPVLADPPQGLPPVAPEEAGFSRERLDLLTSMLRQHVQDGRIAGLVAGVARDGKTVYLESMGWQVLPSGGEGSPMQNDSIFQIRSMSKPITSLAVMQLVEEGQLALSDPVSRYIPSFGNMAVFADPGNPDTSGTRAPAREILIEDLLLNTGGLSHRDSALYQSRGVRSRADTLEELVEKVAAVPLMADPGTQWIYSISATILGRIVEIVSGQRFDEYLQQQIFEPLAMLDTGFYVPAEKSDRLARIYRTPRDGEPLQEFPEMDVPITQNPPLLEGAAGMVSTLPDYLRFLQMFLNGGELDGTRVLSSEGIREMTRNQIGPDLLPIGFSPQRPMHDIGWGYGFSVVIDERRSAAGVNNGEFGWDGSLGTFSWADPETGVIAILMMQVAPASAYNLPDKFKALVHQALVE